MMDEACVPKVYKKCHNSTSICYTIETHGECKLTWKDAKRKCEQNVGAVMLYFRCVHLDFLSSSILSVLNCLF